MGKEEEPIVSLHRPYYITPNIASRQISSSRHNIRNVNMVATSLWSPGPLPAHLHGHRQQYIETGAMHSFHLLLSLTSLGLPQYCERLLALSTLLTDRLLVACERSPSQRSRRPLFWCAGLLRLMADKLEAKMCYYNATMPGLWSELLRALATQQYRVNAAQERQLAMLLAETSDVVCSFGSFLKDVQAFYDGVQAELASLEVFLARRRRTRLFVGFLFLTAVCSALVLVICLTKSTRRYILPLIHSHAQYHHDRLRK